MLLTLLGAGSQTAHAAVPVETLAENSELKESDVASPAVSYIVDLNVVSQYIARGVSYSHQPSVQPGISLSVALAPIFGPAWTDVTATIGAWGSVQAGNPGPGLRNDGAFRGLYEGDVYVGLGKTFKNGVSLAANYYRYTSPAHSFPSYNEFQLVAVYDDGPFWKKLGLEHLSFSPTLLLAREYSRPSRRDAFYLEPALTPSFPLGRGQRGLILSFPTTIGLSDNYYDNRKGGKELFGFLRTGLRITGKILPRLFPGLTLSGHFSFWLLNDHVDNGLGRRAAVGGLDITFAS